MVKVNLKNVSLFLMMVFYSSAQGQNVDKIQKTLEKDFRKGKIEKVEKRAKKYSKKYPGMDVPNYYLSKVEIIKFNRVMKIPQKKQWNYLRKATGYSKKLSDDYSFWKDSIKSIYILYINSWNDDDYNSDHLKKVVQAYSKQTKDTLTVYYNYFSSSSSTSKPKETHSLPDTDSLRTFLIKYASNLVGIPYKYAGETPEQGFDCSGFVMYVYKSIGIELPHNAQMQSQLKGKTLTLEEAKPGDLIFFGSKNSTGWSTQHAGIIYEYKKDEPKVIHCVSRGVSIDGNNSSWDYYWKERILFVKRLPQLDLQKDSQ